jgi:hypothetical protein
MYEQDCAACHGKDGKGDGPAVGALKATPADWTQRSKKHDGKLPANSLASRLKFGDQRPSHGSSEMAVGGLLFPSLDNCPEAVVQRGIATW